MAQITCILPLETWPCKSFEPKQLSIPSIPSLLAPSVRVAPAATCVPTFAERGEVDLRAVDLVL